MNKIIIIIIIQLGLLISSNCHASTIQPKEDINEKRKKNDIINNLPKEYYTNTASTLRGSSTQTETGFNFLRLGDT